VAAVSQCVAAYVVAVCAVVVCVRSELTFENLYPQYRSVLQCVAVYRSVLQCVAVCCSESVPAVSQCVAVYVVAVCNVRACVVAGCLSSELTFEYLYPQRRSVLQCMVLQCILLQRVVVYFGSELTFESVYPLRDPLAKMPAGVPCVDSCCPFAPSGRRPQVLPPIHIFILYVHLYVCV